MTCWEAWRGIGPHDFTIPGVFPVTSVFSSLLVVADGTYATVRERCGIRSMGKIKTTVVLVFCKVC